MDFLNTICDPLYDAVIEPLFQLLNRLLDYLLIRPFVFIGIPIWLHVIILAVLTSGVSFFLRRRFDVERKAADFNARFAEKRRRQKDLQMITGKYSREALYRVTDDELNSDFNTYLAHHYVRYAGIYLLPVFLVLAWLNTVFTENILLARLGSRFVVDLPESLLGLAGLSVTAIFLLTYVVCLIIGFQIRRYKKSDPKLNTGEGK